jgi:hypothetical protein
VIKVKRCELLHSEDGIGAVWFALSFVVIMIMAGIAIDGSRLHLAKAELRKAADAAVLSGAQELEISDESVTNLVNQILAAHNEQGSLKELNIRPLNQRKVSVTLEKEVPLYFMKIFSFSSAPVSVRSTAAANPIIVTSGAVPLGIPEDTVLDFKQEYELKVGAGDSVAGNFGILALSGVGAKPYETALKDGYDGDLYAGQIIDTETGNVAGKTREGVNYRIESSPYDDGDITHRVDPRILKVLVYEPYKIISNQLKSVRIVGFAYFYLEKPMSQTDTTIIGYFIKKVGDGVGDENAKDLGAYAIKLVE